MNYVVDRRLNARHKSTVNRQRFLRRYRKQIKRAVDAAVNERSITDMNRGEQVSIPVEDISEPSFRQGEGGIRNTVYAGNKQYNTGDRVKKPDQGAGQGGGSEASDSGEGDDEFVFQISQSEFLDLMFDELELPHLVRKNLADSDSYKMVQAGISEQGIPSRLNIIRTMRSAHARRLAMSAGARRKLKSVQQQLEERNDTSSDDYLALLQNQEKLKRKISKIPFLDDFDLKYNLQAKQAVPSNKAVMICVMDVSGSMDQSRKDMAKRFFILLHLFLQRNYEKTEVVFVRHHTSAKEVDENEFFYSRETGGTIVSSSIQMIADIMKARYHVRDWNIYVAQASDGDNWKDDSPLCTKLLREKVLPFVNHYSYVEITQSAHQDLWQEYESLAADFDDRFDLKQVLTPADIFPVFKALFKRRHV